MAEIDWNETTGGQRAGGALTMLATWSGATMSAALIGGLVVWGWQLAVRDVAGVPVIRAIEGPMRVAPATPGGERAAYQGLTVNRVVEDASEAPPERLVLAPADADLAEEDLALVPVLAENAAEAGAPETPDGAPPVADSSSPVADTALPLDPPAQQPALAATDLAVAEALGLTSDAVLVLTSAGESTAGWPRPVPRPLAVPARSRARRPGRDATLSMPRTWRPARGSSSLARTGPRPRPSLPGMRWRRGSTATSTESRRVVQQADSGGRTFWRLRAAGFADLADARRFCSALVARQAECIPAVAR